MYNVRCFIRYGYPLESLYPDSSNGNPYNAESVEIKKRSQFFLQNIKKMRHYLYAYRDVRVIAKKEPSNHYLSCFSKTKRVFIKTLITLVND